MNKYPSWFQDCIDVPVESGEVVVDDCRINYVAWGDQGKPGIVLLHGSNAHLEWWRPIAPMLSDQFRVVAMDSSGSGNSGWRKNYTGELFAKEAISVAKAAKLGDKPFVVGHSFGGFVTLETGHLYGSELGGVIMVDSTVQPPEMYDEFKEFREQRRSEPVRPTRVYPDKQTALGRFRLVPEQTCKNEFLLAYIAEQSIRQVEGGWTWKFDPGMFRNLTMQDDNDVSTTEKLLNMNCPSAFIWAEESLDYSERSAEYTREIAENRMPIFKVPGTFHHLMFDEPNAVAMAIKATLLAWQH